MRWNRDDSAGRECSGHGASRRRGGSPGNQILAGIGPARPGESGGLGLALSGCLRVITHPKIFKKPTPLTQALEFVDNLRSRDEVHLLGPGAGHWKIFVDLCRRRDARGNLVPDAFHAALAIELGCEWLTLNRGFARFPGLKWRHPLD